MKYENVDKVIQIFYKNLPYGNEYSDAIYELKFESKEKEEIKRYLLANSILEIWDDGPKHILSAKGILIAKSFGTLEKYLEKQDQLRQKELDLEKTRNEKLYDDAKLSKWQVKIFWPLFAISIFSFLFAVFSIIRQVVEEPIEQKIKRLVQQEISLQQQKSTTSDVYK